MDSSLEIIEKIKSSGLTGRGGAGYPTGLKWESMYNSSYSEIYIVVNGSEGEPATEKDGYILENYLTELVEGVRIAYKIFSHTKKIYFYLRKDYFQKYKKLIEKKTSGLPVVVFKEPGGYLCGENTTLINSIEGKRLEPRRKPPYCSQVGLWGLPTLVNNIETFYRVYQIVNNQYKKTRFYTLTGEITNPGVYDLSLDLSLKQLFEKTDNQLTENHFVQVGGGASGQYFSYDELESQSANLGTGAVIVYNCQKIDFFQLMKIKLDFLLKENCGKCTPCREGLFVLKQMIEKKQISDQMRLIFSALKKTSFCGLGEGAGVSFISLWNKKDKIWKK